MTTKLRYYPITSDPRDREDWDRDIWEKVNRAISLLADLFTDTSQVTWTRDTDTGKYTATINITSTGSSTDISNATIRDILSYVGLMFSDTDSIDFTFTADGDSRSIIADVIPGGVDHDQLLNTHNLTTDIDHDQITNTHNLTTDIDHDQITNTHNLTTDIDHGSIEGLGDDDHTQYHNDTRGDARYYRENEHINVSSGAGDAAKPIILAADGKISPTMYNSGAPGATDAQNFSEWIPLSSYLASSGTASSDFGAVVHVDGTVHFTGNVTIPTIDAGGAGLRHKLLTGIPTQLRPSVQRDIPFSYRYTALPTTDQRWTGGITIETGGDVYVNSTLLLHNGDTYYVDGVRYHTDNMSTVTPAAYAFPNGIETTDIVASSIILASSITVGGVAIEEWADIDHDSLFGFVSAEHIDWTNATQDLLTTGLVQGNGAAITSSILIGPASSTVTIDQDGVTLGGNATRWSDKEFLLEADPGGTGQPDWTTFGPSGNIKGWGFHGTTAGIDVLYGTLEVPHDWKVGTDIYIHAHWAAETADTGSFTLNLERQVWNNGDVIPAPTVANTTISAPGVAWTSGVNNLATVDMSTFSLGAQIKIAIQRDPAGSFGTDDYVGDVHLSTVAIHYQVDTPGGSKEVTTK